MLNLLSNAGLGCRQNPEGPAGRSPALTGDKQKDVAWVAIVDLGKRAHWVMSS